MSKSKLLPAIGLVLLLNVSAIDRAHAATLPQAQQAASDPFVNFLANQLGLGGVLSFFSDSLAKASTFMTTLTTLDINVPKEIEIGLDGLQIGEAADTKLNEKIESAWNEHTYMVPDIGNAKSQYYSSQAEALGRFRSSAEGQKDAVANAKSIGGATDKSAAAVTDSDAAESTFERTNQLNKNVNALTVTSAMNAKLTLENNRLQSLSVAATAAAQKTAARKSAIETQDNQIRGRVISEESMSTVLSGPAFIKPPALAE